VVVDAVAEGGGAAAAGVQPGDLLCEWRREDGAGPGAGRLSSPFDLDRLVVEESPRGVVTLEGRRGDTVLAFELVHGQWNLRVRPELGEEESLVLSEALATGGVEAAERLAALARSVTGGGVRVWLLAQAAVAAGIEDGEALWDEALAATAQAPDTLAWVHEDHAEALLAASRYDQAAEAHARALEARPRGSLAAARSLQDLGRVAMGRGDLGAAETFFGQALEILELLAPRSMGLAVSLDGLGNVAMNRGDQEAAEAWHRQALEIRERFAPDSMPMAASLNNLGVVAAQRGDVDAAEAWYRQSLHIKDRLAPESLSRAMTLDNLGVMAQTRGDLEAADSWHHQALEIRERLAPGSMAVATSLNNLGVVAESRGDLAAAEGWFLRALEIKERQGPGSLDLATTLTNLGAVAWARRDIEAAEEWFRQALELNQRLAPGSAAEALSLGNLAQAVRRAGRADEALDLLRRGVAALEAQQRRLGASPAGLAGFREKFLGIYRDLVGLLLDSGHTEEAFAALESSRARALLALLAERDVVLRDAPPELDRERRLANAEHERAMAALGEAANEAERQAILEQVQAIRLRQDEIRSRARATSPRLAELRYPEPLDLEAARSTLEPGTLVLAWMLDEERSSLFALERDSFDAWPLEVGEPEVREQVERLRALLQDPSSPVAWIGRRGAQLSEAVLGPARDRISDAERLLLLPDGPLWLVPFAAVPGPSASGDLLIAGRPLTVVSSVTVFAHLKRDRKDHPARSLVAFGDPLYPAQPVVLRQGPTTLEPLPGTRAELEAVQALFADGLARLYLGAEATEARAKAVGQDADVVHLAVHGLVDERFPLESALVLALPPPEELRSSPPDRTQDNGLLQAWEVLESMRIDADLVTLSACDTALGKEVAGEGILGLVRAFQYAGARTVLASLWPVGDESTVELMRRFYAGLRNGLPKDEALRQAQLALASGPIRADSGGEKVVTDATHPFFWAAFELVGDWR